MLRKLAQRADPPAKVFLLNPDARLETNAVAQLSAFLDDHPKAAVVGSAILHEGSFAPATCAFRFPGALSEFVEFREFGPLARLFKTRTVAFPADMPLQQVDWVSGASMMARLDALAAVEFFDPDFFLYFEEVDLMHRLKRRGWQVWHLPQAKVVHVAGAATGVTRITDEPHENLETLKRISEALMEYETIDAADLDMLIAGTPLTREKPPPRVTLPRPPKDEKKKDKRILDALDGLPGKIEPGTA